MTRTAPAEPDERLAAGRAGPTSTPLSTAARWVERLGARPRLLVAVAAGLAAAWSIVASLAVFPFLSNNHDEGVYLLQADAIGHGHLFPRAPAHAAAFLPWFTARSGHRFVPKYSPVHASVLALGKLLLGSERAAIGLVAAGVIVATYLLGVEVLGDRRHAALASVFVLLSPLFLLQSATFLAYCTSLLLLESFAFALLRGARLERRWWLVLAGLLAGVAFFARPYDAFLFTLPLGAYLAVRHRRRLRTLAQEGGWLLVGLTQPLVAIAAFNAAATGSALRSPFSLLDSRDTLGFGKRSLDPTNPPVRFTPALGFRGLSRHMLLTSFWCFGGLVLVGLAVAFLASRRFRGRAAWLALVAVTIPLGYLFFWGTYGAAVWGAPWYLGPYYYTPVLVPLAVLGAGGFARLWRHHTRMAAFALVGMVALSGFVVGKALQKNLSFTDDDRRLYSGLERARLRHALVFLPGRYGARLGHPFAAARNPVDYDGKVLYAIDRGDPANLDVVADYPGRTPYMLDISGAYRATPPDEQLSSSLRRLRVVRGDAVSAELHFRNPTELSVLRLTVTVNGRTDSYVLDDHSSPGTNYQLVLRIAGSSTQIAGPVTAHSSQRVASADRAIVIALSADSGDVTLPQPLYQRRLALRLRGETLYAMLPGTSLNLLGSQDPLTVPAS